MSILVKVEEGRSYIVGFSFKPRWSWSDSSKEQSNLGIRHYRTVTMKGALTYVSIDNFSCAFLIYGLLSIFRCIYNCRIVPCKYDISKQYFLQIWHKQIVQTQMRRNQCGISSEFVLFVNINYEIDTLAYVDYVSVELLKIYPPNECRQLTFISWSSDFAL